MTLLTTNRAIAIADIRMQTGRDYLQAHLHRFRLADDDYMWPLCCEGTIHRKNIFTCSELDDQLFRSGYQGEIQCKMAQQLRARIGYQKQSVDSFIKVMCSYLLKYKNC